MRHAAKFGGWFFALAFAFTASHFRPTLIHASEKTHIQAVHWEPETLTNGSPIIFRVITEQPITSLAGAWLQHDFVFSVEKADAKTKTKTWNALAGISLETPPGIYTLTLNGTTAEGARSSLQQAIPVAKAKYRVIEITVPKQFTEPSAEQLQQISDDKKLKESVFSKVTPEREWARGFAFPVDAPTTDSFGTQRTINGKVQSTHQGTDFAVSAGTPVSAINRGRVILARPLFFEGNCVVIDHGQGFLSLYLHLSKFAVKEGDDVDRGQQIGFSGGTGRATGPHLHLAVRWQGVYVDPATLLKLNLP